MHIHIHSDLNMNIDIHMNMDIHMNIDIHIIIIIMQIDNYISYYLLSYSLLIIPYWLFAPVHICHFLLRGIRSAAAPPGLPLRHHCASLWTLSSLQNWRDLSIW